MRKTSLWSGIILAAFILMCGTALANGTARLTLSSDMACDQLTIGGTSDSTLNVVGNTLDVGTGGIAIEANGTLTSGAGTIQCAGDWRNANTFTAGTGTVVLDGTNQSMTGSTTFNHLSIDGGGTKTLSSPAAVENTLTLTDGLVALEDNDLTLGASATVAGSPSASNMIVTNGSGVLKKMFSAAGTFTYPVGDDTGTVEYSPATLDFTGGTFGGEAYAAVTVTNAKQPDNTSTTNYLNRYWTVTQSSITGFSCNTTFNYLPADVAGTETDICGGQYNGVWTVLNPVNTGTHTFDATVTGFSDFTGIELSTPAATAATSITETGFTANWNGVAGATGYRLDVSGKSDFSTYVTGYRNKDVGHVTSAAVSGLTKATMYYYRLRAEKGGSASDDSNTISVATADGTGVPGDVQDAGPNDGDGNGDGVKDKLQTTVASLPSASPGASYLSVELSECGQLSNVAATTYASVGEADPGYEYPFDLVAFTIPCASATVRIYYHGATGLGGYTYRKFGPTPGDWNTSLWYTMPGVSLGTKVIGTGTVPYAKFTLTEAELGDDTPVFPIVDKGGVARGNGIPTLNQWGMALLGLLLAVMATWRIRRKKHAQGGRINGK